MLMLFFHMKKYILQVYIYLIRISMVTKMKPRISTSNIVLDTLLESSFSDLCWKGEYDVSDK